MPDSIMSEDVLNLLLPWSRVQEALSGADWHDVNNLRLDFYRLNDGDPSEGDIVGSWWGMWERWNVNYPQHDTRYLEIVTRLKVLTIIPKIYPDLADLCDAKLNTFAVTMAKNIAGIEPDWTSLQDQIQTCVDALESGDSERIAAAKDVFVRAVQSKRQSLGPFERNGLMALEDIMSSATTNSRSTRAHLLKLAHYMVANLSPSKRTDNNGGSPDYESKLFGEI